MDIYSQNFDLNLYKIFCAVSENKSISKAAESLFVSQQAVSYSIKQLETALGGKLFFRTPKGVFLTPEGEKLYLTIRQSLENIVVGEKIFKEDKELNSGHLYIGCTYSFFNICLYKYINTFHKKYPNIEFHIFSSPAINLLNMLKNHELDMFISLFEYCDIPTTLSKKTFAKFNHCFVCNESFRFLSDKKNVSLEELSKYPLLLLNKNSYERIYLDTYLKNKNIEIKSTMDFTNHDHLIKLVKEGIGIGYTMKETVEQDLKSGTLFEIPVSEVNYTSNVGVIYDENYLSFAARKFIEMMEE